MGPGLRPRSRRPAHGPGHACKSLSRSHRLARPGPGFARLGTHRHIPLRFDRARRLWSNPALREDFDSLSLRRPEGFAAYFLLNDAGVRRLAVGSVLNTDDLTLLEYHAPRALLRHGLVQTNEDMLQRFRDGLLPANLDPAEAAAALEGAAETHLELSDTSAAQGYLAALEGQPPTSTLALLRGR